ncbi:hypothetical protein F5Y19DRAFT_427742 [Xylariaceae sp. FL1651]|nr:hypothetical protein F5Y19DRAFT_427742 [Xylariaceae sp. FL1651]
MPVSRKKACHQCRTAKARCSLDSVCFRCLKKGLSCEYVGFSLRGTPYARPNFGTTDQGMPSADPDVTKEPLSNHFGLPDLEIPYHNFEGIFDELPVLESSEDNNLVSNPADAPRDVPWEEASWNRDKELSHLSATECSLNMGISRYSMPSGTPATLSPFFFLTKAPLNDLLRNGDQSTDQQPDPTVTAIEVYGRRYENFLTLRQAPTIEKSLMAKIIMGQLENYPKMLIQAGNLPPFIYPQCVLEDRLCRQCTATTGIHQCLPEPLANCTSLVQMFYSRNAGNRQLVWKMIYDEQNRLHKQSHSYDDTILLAAIQAMSIYMLVQAQDSESIAQNDVSSLIVAISEMATILHSRSKYQHDIYTDPNLNKKTWVSCEGMRRVLNLFYVVRAVLVVLIGDPNQAGCGSILATPLPCMRELWDPNTTESWAARLHRYKSRRACDRVLLISDLLHRLNGEESNTKNDADTLVQKDLVNWCESLDDFGILVWMALLLNRQMS